MLGGLEVIENEIALFMNCASFITTLSFLSITLKIFRQNISVINCREQIQEFLLSDDEAES